MLDLVLRFTTNHHAIIEAKKAEEALQAASIEEEAEASETVNEGELVD